MIELNSKMNSVVLWMCLFFESLCLFIYAPNYYSYSFNLFCFIHYILSCIIFFKLDRKKNYFDFDVFFMVTYLFVMFIYPVFIYNDNPSFSVFKYDFNEDLISKGSALSLLGIQSYILGASFVKSKVDILKENKKEYIKSSILTVLLYFILIAFILSGGLQTFSDLYAKKKVESGISYYILLLIPALAFPAISSWFYNIKLRSTIIKRGDLFDNFFLLLFVVILVLLLLGVGSRTLPIQFVLFIGGIYSMLFYNLSPLKLFPFLLLGVLVMFYVLLLRSNTDASTANFDFFDIFMDLIINNRNTYVALDYVDKQGITWGESMLASMLSPIPFLQSVIINMFGLNSTDCASSLVITKLTLGSEKNLDVGFGTNIIADLYIAYGLCGVVLGMLFLGYFVNKLRKRRENIYYLVAYGVMMSYAVYLVRAEFLFFLRLLLWSLAVVNIVKLHPIVIKCGNRKF